MPYKQWLNVRYGMKTTTASSIGTKKRHKKKNQHWKFSGPHFLLPLKACGNTKGSAVTPDRRRRRVRPGWWVNRGRNLIKEQGNLFWGVSNYRRGCVKRKSKCYWKADYADYVEADRLYYQYLLYQGIPSFLFQQMQDKDKGKTYTRKVTCKHRQ